MNVETSGSFEKASAWVNLHIVPVAFLISLISMVLTGGSLLLSVYQYRQATEAQVRLSLEQLKTKRLDDARQLLLFIGADNHPGNGFASLAAIRELENYPELQSVYVYMLKSFQAQPHSDNNDEFIEAARHLVESTKRPYEPLN